MKVAVITPYYSESIELLDRCRQSVENQTHQATHIWVADGLPNETLISKAEQHLTLPIAHGDYGDTPRLIGTISAYQQGFDAICWLDADNWFEPTHVEHLLRIADQEVVSVVTATRILRRNDGSVLGICGESDGQNFCDTNCYMVMRDAIPVVAPAWGFKAKGLGVIGDRFVWKTVTENYPMRGHCDEPTVNYVTGIAAHYLAAGEEPPPNARVIVQQPGQSTPISVRYADFRT